jgi:dienelactone hydrolase
VLGWLEYDDYAIARVYFESWPGFLCTGNLYVPRPARLNCPAILCPHGHWAGGRLEDTAVKSNRARCITFARMGMVAFSYDMLSYNDSLQMPDHNAASLRSSLWAYSHMRLQTWNSIRAIDWLQSLPEVDPARIGCTGASGGATQTFILSAVDARVTASVPVNMISSAFQGGCVCEGYPGLRTRTNNLEIAAMAAPRPMLLISTTGDHTVTTPAVELPALRSVYTLYGAEERVTNVQITGVHNYDAASRDAAYRFFAHVFLGNEALGAGVERPYVCEPAERMRVFPSGQLPTSAHTAERLAEEHVQRCNAGLARLMPKSADDLERLRAVTRTRLTHMLDASWPDPQQVLAQEGPRGIHRLGANDGILLGRVGAGDRVQGAYYPTPSAAPRGYVLLVHEAGLVGLHDAYGRAGERVQALRSAGWHVLAIEPLHTGQVPADALPRNSKDWFWLGNNPALLGERVQDILTGLAYLSRVAQGQPVALVGLERAGLWALLAAALCPLPLRMALDLACIDPRSEGAFLDDLYAPSLFAAGGLEVASALLAPRSVTLAGTQRFPLEWAQAAYAACGAGAALRVAPDISAEVLGAL